MLGNKLQQLRHNKKLTQEELAKALDISRGTYAHYEINKRQPDYGTLHKIADFFDVSVDYLLGRTNTPSPPEKKQSRHVIEIEADLSPESQEELKKFAELLKIKEMAEHNKKQHKESRSASGTDKQ